jgi:hypothetical protein
LFDDLEYLKSELKKSMVIFVTKEATRKKYMEELRKSGEEVSIYAINRSLYSYKP